MDDNNGREPALSVVLVTASNFASLKRTVRFLRAQTVCDQIELIIVAPDELSVADRAPEETDCFFDFAVVPAGLINNMDKAAVNGIAKTSAPIIALVEDHVFPEPNWAEAIIKAHQGSWSAVGSTILNANPESQFSWSNLMISYGWWTEPVERGKKDDISRHNISIKKSVLLPYGDDLVNYLGRGETLIPDLLANGHEFFLETDARIEHLNPSTLSATAALRYNAGRLYAANRAQRERWPVWKRILYFIAGPLIPPLRFIRYYKEFFAGGRRRELTPRVYPALFLSLVFDGLGQMIGYIFGKGGSAEILESFEYDRIRHLRPSERPRFA